MAAATVFWPPVTATMSELYAWAKSLKAGNGMKHLEALNLLIWRWSSAFQSIGEHDRQVLENKFNELVGLPNDTDRDPHHDRFHERLTCWTAAGNRNLAVLTRLVIPNFSAASNAKTVGRLCEAVSWPWIFILYIIFLVKTSKLCKPRTLNPIYMYTS